MTYKLQISKPGYTVETETNPDNLIFSSDYNTLKYYTNGAGTLSVHSNGTALVSAQDTISHNLGYIPFFVCFANADSGTLASTVPLMESTLGVTRYVSAFADSTNLYVIVESNTSGTAKYAYSYKIYKNNTGL